MTDRAVGLSLVDNGFTPGAIFEAPGSSFVIAQLNNSGEFEGLFERKAKAKERLVVISHPCDIASADEPYVETLICKRAKPGSVHLNRIARFSPRQFVVDSNTAWVAFASYRIKIDKHSLRGITPEMAMDEGTLHDFIQWLARRYDRPIVADDVHDRFHVHVNKLLDDLADAADARFRLVNGIVREIRVFVPAIITWPCPIGLLFLTKHPPTKAEFQAIEQINSEISQVVADHFDVSDPTIVTLEDVPYGMILGSQPLILEYLSKFQEGAVLPR